MRRSSHSACSGAPTSRIGFSPCAPRRSHSPTPPMCARGLLMRGQRAFGRTGRGGRHRAPVEGGDALGGRRGVGGRRRSRCAHAASSRGNASSHGSCAEGRQISVQEKPESDSSGLWYYYCTMRVVWWVPHHSPAFASLHARTLLIPSWNSDTRFTVGEAGCRLRPE